MIHFKMENGEKQTEMQKSIVRKIKEQRSLKVSQQVHAFGNHLGGFKAFSMI